MLPLVLIALPALVQESQRPPQPPPPPGMMSPQMFHHVARELGLSEDQMARAKAIFDAHKAAMESKHEAVRKAHEALMAALEGDKGGDIKSLNQALADRQLDAMLEGRALHKELLAILTPDQQQKAKEMMAHHMGGPMGQNHGGPGGQGGHGGPGGQGGPGGMRGGGEGPGGGDHDGPPPPPDGDGPGRD